MMQENLLRLLTPINNLYRIYEEPFQIAPRRAVTPVGSCQPVLFVSGRMDNSSLCYISIPLPPFKTLTFFPLLTGPSSCILWFSSWASLFSWIVVVITEYRLSSLSHLSPRHGSRHRSPQHGDIQLSRLFQAESIYTLLHSVWTGLVRPNASRG